MYTRNRRGLIQEPCDTPIFVRLTFESGPFTMQNYFLSEIFDFEVSSSGWKSFMISKFPSLLTRSTRFTTIL